MAVRTGGVILDGQPLNHADVRIRLTADLSRRLSISSFPLDPLPGVVILMNKPVGVTCSHKDVGPIVYDLLPRRWRARNPPISTIGRLDKDTSGLLLLTDDGQLLHRAIAPKSKVAKCYRAKLARPLNGSEYQALASGRLMLDGERKPLLPVVMIVDEASPVEKPTVYLTLTEGRYHQVRRMFAALGNHVTELHRESFGGATLPNDLASGQWLVLDVDTVASIFADSSQTTK